MRKYIVLILMFLSIVNMLGAEPRTYYRNALVFAYSPVNSIFEDDNIILQIYNGRLYARNKTEKTIFIDLSQCFLINNGASYPMYTSAINEENASKAKISSSIDEFISIAPATGSRQNDTYIATLNQGIYGSYSTTEGPLGGFSDYYVRFLRLINNMVNESLKNDPKKKKYTGTVSRHLTEDESISNIGASIAYSFNKRSEDWTNITISTWVSDVIFAPYFAYLPNQISNQYKKGYGVKESVGAKIYIKADSPFEFDIDKSPIIVADWEGNFNEGTFNLRNIEIEIKGQKYHSKGLAMIGASPSELSKTFVKFQGADQDWGDLKYTKYGKTAQEGINRFTHSVSKTLPKYHIKYVIMDKNGEIEKIVKEETIQVNQDKLSFLIKSWQSKGIKYSCIVERLN